MLLRMLVLSVPELGGTLCTCPHRDMLGDTGMPGCSSDKDMAKPSTPSPKGPMRTLGMVLPGCS